MHCLFKKKKKKLSRKEQYKVKNKSLFQLPAYSEEVTKSVTHFSRPSQKYWNIDTNVHVCE